MCVAEHYIFKFNFFMRIRNFSTKILPPQFNEEGDAILTESSEFRSRKQINAHEQAWMTDFLHAE